MKLSGTLEGKANKIKRVLTPWLFVLPAIAITLLLRYYTIGQSLLWSFFQYDTANPPGEFVGLQNFQFLFTSSEFWTAFSNTIIFVLLTFLLTFWVPIVQALFLSQVKIGRNLFSTLYIIPSVVPGTVMIVIWKWIWDVQNGPANSLLGHLGIEPQMWLGDPNFVKFCIIFPGILGGGISVILYLSAIMGVSTEIQEAAKIDGCTRIQNIWYIILPNIKFLIKIQMIMTTIWSLQIMDNIYQYSGGGPAGASNSIGLFIYNQVNERFDYGRASAAALVLLVLIAIITMVQMNMESKET